MPSQFSTEINTDQTVLVRFRGNLKQIDREEVTYEEGGRKSVRASFAFTDVEVLEATEPYNHPIYVAKINYTLTSKTKWAALAESVNKILPVHDLDLLIGKNQEWYYGPATLRQRAEDGTWGDQQGKAWQVVKVDGYGESVSGGKTITDTLIDMADGQTDSAFYQAVFSSQALKQMPGFTDVVSAITNRELLSAFLSNGEMTRDDDGIYHKVVK